MNPNDVLASNITNPAHADGGVSDDDVGDTQEGVNPTQSEGNLAEYGSAVNSDG